MTSPVGPTYTYSGDPSSSPKDAVRYLAKATGSDKATGFVSDEEIAWELSQEPNVYLAAAAVAENISAYYGNQRSKTVGPLTITGKDQAATYAALAQDLRRRSAAGGVAGAEFTGCASHLFEIGMHDIPPGGFVAPWEDLTGIYDR